MAEFDDKRIEEYVRLVLEVREIDEIASDILSTKVINLESFVPTINISSCFVWSELEDDTTLLIEYRHHRFWADLNQRVRDKRKERKDDP